MRKALYPLVAALLVATVGCSNGWWGGTDRSAENHPETPEPGVSPPSMGELRNGLEAPRPVVPNPGTPRQAAPEVAGQGAQAPEGRAPEPVLPSPPQTAQASTAAPEPVLPGGTQTAQSPPTAQGPESVASQPSQAAQAPVAGEERGMAAQSGASPQAQPQGRAGRFAQVPAPVLPAETAASGQAGSVTRGYRPAEEMQWQQPRRGQGQFVPDDIFTEPASPRANAPDRRARAGYEEPLMDVLP